MTNKIKLWKALILSNKSISPESEMGRLIFNGLQSEGVGSRWSPLGPGPVWRQSQTPYPHPLPGLGLSICQPWIYVFFTCTERGTESWNLPKWFWKKQKSKAGPVGEAATRPSLADVDASTLPPLPSLPNHSFWGIKGGWVVFYFFFFFIWIQFRLTWPEDDWLWFHSFKLLLNPTQTTMRIFTPALLSGTVMERISRPRPKSHPQSWLRWFETRSLS